MEIYISGPVSGRSEGSEKGSDTIEAALGLSGQVHFPHILITPSQSEEEVGEAGAFWPAGKRFGVLLIGVCAVSSLPEGDGGARGR